MKKFLLCSLVSVLLYAPLAQAETLHSLPDNSTGLPALEIGEIENLSELPPEPIVLPVPLVHDLQSSWKVLNVADFVPSKGDYMMAYLPTGTGYIINEEKHVYMTFPLLSGQKRMIYYLRHYYFAATPEQEWVVKSKDVKRDRVTFGPTGEFLRLYHKNNPTPYGIHGHKYYQTMVSRESKFASYGCLIVSDENLDIIEKSYNANGNELRVVTTSDASMLKFLNH